MCAPTHSRKQNSISRCTESINHLTRDVAIESCSEVDSDIEMGSWEMHSPTGNEYEHSVLDDQQEVQALPPMPFPPKSKSSTWLPRKL
jgi:hypothetical protein